MLCLRMAVCLGLLIQLAGCVTKTPLMQAAESGDLEMVRGLLKDGVDVNARNELGDTALLWAVKKGRPDIVRLLLDRGAAVDAKENNGISPLILAAVMGRAEIVPLLLDRGADINATTRNGDTALIWAVAKGHNKTARLLLDRGADTRPTNILGNSAAMLAQASGNKDLAQLLLQSEGAATRKPSKPGSGAVPTPAPSSKPAEASDSNQLSGLYHYEGGYMGWTPTINGPQMKMITTESNYLFFPDGRVYNDVPKGGLSNFDFSRASRSDPRNCGTYKILGGQIRFDWGGGRGVEVLSFSRDGDSLVINDIHHYSLSQAKQTITRLNGTYHSVGGSQEFAKTGPDNPGGISSEYSITFQPNGRFFEKNLFAMTSRDRTDDRTANSSLQRQGSGSGTYRIQGGTIEFSYNNGQKRTASFYVLPQQQNQDAPREINIDRQGLLLTQ
jgi:hypothetical protein